MCDAYVCVMHMYSNLKCTHNHTRPTLLPHPVQHHPPLRTSYPPTSIHKPLHPPLYTPPSHTQVIEMTGVSPASDIWSVGCLAVELLTGTPPYYELQPMPALFRIVQDMRPPLPPNISPEFEAFLIQCFQKVCVLPVFNM